MKSVVEMLDLCHPNVVLVEKSVSRDIQESILKKGMTLVFDMKLHRLERVARCTGSPILSSDSLTSQKLKQCDAFYVERFVEDLVVSGEGGKKPSKTLMFIEGCPTRLGCTVSLSFLFFPPSIMPDISVFFFSIRNKELSNTKVWNVYKNRRICTRENRIKQK